MLFSPHEQDEYELIDFGRGRRLERFGALVLDRPWPAVARSEPRRPDVWDRADARFEGSRGGEGRWVARGALPRSWKIRLAGLFLQLKPTPWGQVGVFPEQQANWQWLARQLGPPPGASQPALTIPTQSQPARLRILNLFAYTGATTLAAAACWAEVVHVDAAANIVAWARQNAALCGLEGRPIRWIVEDAQKFVRRELRRGNRYHGVILDPPSYGRGPHGEVWRLSKHLGGLLAGCAELLAGQRRLLVLSCHTPGFGPERLKTMAAAALGNHPPGTVEAEPLRISTADGRQMPCGAVVRWSWSQ